MSTIIALPSAPSIPTELAHLPFGEPFVHTNYWNVPLELRIGARSFEGTGWSDAGLGRLAHVNFNLVAPIAELDEAITAAWGEPHIADKKRSKLAWFDDAESPSLRILLTKHEKGSKLTLSPVEPLEVFFRRALALLQGDAQVPLIGMTAPEVAQKFGDAFREGKFVLWKPNPYGDYPSQAAVFFDAKGKAEKVELTSPVGTLDAVKPLQKAIKVFAESHGIELMPKRYIGSVVRDGKKLEVGTSATATTGLVRFALSTDRT